MPERNRYSGYEEGSRQDRSRQDRNWEGRDEGGRGSMEGRDARRGYERASWESGSTGYGHEQGGYGDPAWEAGRGYGPFAGSGGWEREQGRVSSRHGQQGWQGPQRSDQWDNDHTGQGYGQGGYAGYGSRGEHAAQSYGPHGQHGGGFGTEASYSNQGRHVGYAHRGEEAHYGPYGAQGEYAPRGGFRSERRDYEPDYEARRRYGRQRDDERYEPGALSATGFMGEGYGGPVHPVTRAAGQRARDPRHWPKSYTRSDDRIREDLYERIMHHDYIDASEVTVNVSQGMVTLEGSVPERHMKHDIENIVDGCPGVKDIDNKLRVARHEWQPGTAQHDQSAIGGASPNADAEATSQGFSAAGTQSWGRGRSSEEHGSRTTGGAMGYSADTSTAVPGSTAPRSK